MIISPQLGYVYCIVDNTNGNKYYGSTIHPVEKRILQHITNYKRYQDNINYNYCSSYEVLKNNNYTYHVVEDICYQKGDTKNSPKSLRQRELYYIINNKCVNINGKGIKMCQIKERRNSLINDYLQEHMIYENKKREIERKMEQQKKRYIYNENIRRMKEKNKHHISGLTFTSKEN